MKSVTHHSIQKDNLRSILNMLNIEGKVVVGNNVAKTDDLLLNKDAFRTWQLIRLPAELGGDKNDVSAFRLYSAVCLHLWCLWRYVPLERDSNDPSRIINGRGQCPCHGSAYDPLIERHLEVRLRINLRLQTCCQFFTWRLTSRRICGYFLRLWT